MNIHVAQSAGFCWGVRQAMDAVLEASARWGSKGPVQTFGPLIHNPQALEQVARRGVTQSDSVMEVGHGTIVVRAHGIPVQELRALQEMHRRKEVRLINGTCPEVAKVQARIKRYASKGYFTVLLGTPGHAEAVAHESYAASGFTVISNLHEAKALTFEAEQKVLVIAQTTFLVQEFETIAAHIRSKVRDCVVLNTICKDTWKRQEEAENLCHRVDHVVIVGGKTSNNTRHLVDLARDAGKPFQWVESSGDLDLEALRGISEVGVLAGASTPTWTVDEVVETLEQAGQVSLVRMALRMTQTLQLPVVLGTAILTAILHRALGWSSGWSGFTLPAAFHLAMCSLVPYLDPMGLGLKGQIHGRFLSRQRYLLIGIGSVAGFMAMLASVHLGVVALLGTLAWAAVVVGYVLFRSHRLSLLQHVPAIKELGLAWTPVWLAIVLPWSSGYASTLVRLALASWGIFALAMATHTLRHLRAFRKDQVLGWEILTVAIGSRAAKWVSGLLITSAIGSLFFLLR